MNNAPNAMWRSLKRKGHCSGSEVSISEREWIFHFTSGVFPPDQELGGKLSKELDESLKLPGSGISYVIFNVVIRIKEKTIARC